MKCVGREFLVLSSLDKTRGEKLDFQVPKSLVQFFDEVPVVRILLPLFNRTINSNELQVSRFLVQGRKQVNNKVGADERVDITNIDISNVLEGRDDLGELFGQLRRINCDSENSLGRKSELCRMADIDQLLNPVAISDDLFGVVDIGCELLSTRETQVLEGDRKEDLGVQVEFVLAALAKMSLLVDLEVWKGSGQEESIDRGVFELDELGGGREGSYMSEQTWSWIVGELASLFLLCEMFIAVADEDIIFVSQIEMDQDHEAGRSIYLHFIDSILADCHYFICQFSVSGP